jgi:hypothetical protein
MKFDNAYDLVLHLFDKGLLTGLSLGIRGDYSIDPTIQDSDLLELLTEIFDEWRWNSGDATYQGWYEFGKGSDGNLGFQVYVSEDIKEHWGTPFDIEPILKIISDELLLSTIDKEEFLQYQICLDLEIEYPDISKLEYDLSVFKIRSRNEGDEIDEEINNKIQEVDLLKIQQLVIDNLAQTHKSEHCYVGFSLIIEDDNDFNNYVGTGFETQDEIKDFLENYPIEFELE